MWTLWLHWGKHLVLFKEGRWPGDTDTLTTINKSAAHITKSCFMRPGKTMASISAWGSATPSWMPYSKSTEALTNVSCLPAWTNVGCGSNLKDWIWAVFLGLPVASLHKLLVINCFLSVIQSDWEGLWQNCLLMQKHSPFYYSYALKYFTC